MTNTFRGQMLGDPHSSHSGTGRVERSFHNLSIMFSHTVQ